jgi:UDP-glucose 4-epimerase
MRAAGERAIGTLEGVRILVAGFIGSHLCDLSLARGHRVIGTDDLSTGRSTNLRAADRHAFFAFVQADIRGPEMVDVFDEYRPHVVMHLAAQSGVRSSLEDPRLDASVNIDGLLNVLECSTRVGVTKVLFASSGGTIYGSPENPPVAEGARLRARPCRRTGSRKRWPRTISASTTNTETWTSPR